MHGRGIYICSLRNHQGGVRGLPARRPKVAIHGGARGATRQASQDSVHLSEGIGDAPWNEGDTGKANGLDR
eukprot:5731839-Pyramimonas_sp.AAC.1